ncbi:MAG TPA: hypothetical protein VNR66_14100 [Solirubrobacteraceae bacterium]|nr:hypothetical protein [Solirubrobacteraceae bacterium]
MSSQGSGLIVILFSFGLAGGIVARTKGNSFMLWFLIAFCVPFLGLIAAAMTRSEARELRRQCPSCGRVLKLHDTVCMRCGEELEFPDEAIASELAMKQRAA